MAVNDPNTPPFIIAATLEGDTLSLTTEGVNNVLSRVRFTLPTDDRQLDLLVEKLSAVVRARMEAARKAKYGDD